MRIGSNREAMAIAFVIDIAASKQGLGQKHLSKHLDVPHRSAETLLQLLRREGLLNAKRGLHGFYTLAKDPTEISLGDVARVVQAEMRDHSGVRGRPAAIPDIVKVALHRAREAYLENLDDVKVAAILPPDEIVDEIE